MLRVIADTASGTGWLRWATPLGWAEELRPFAGARPLVLLLPIAATALLLAGRGAHRARRDIGTGLLPARDVAAPRLRLLSLADRAGAARRAREPHRLGRRHRRVRVHARRRLESVTSANIPDGVQEQIAKLGAGSLLTPAGYLAFVFVFFVLAVSLFAVRAGRRRAPRGGRAAARDAVRAARRPQRVARRAPAADGLHDRGARACWPACCRGRVPRRPGVSISLPRMLEAGANCLPVALLFLGVAALAYALVPRASAAIAYGLVAITFLWQLVGSLLGAPAWLVDLTPFAHVGLVPAEPFRAGAAAAMLAIGAAAALLAIASFRRRDLLGA